MAETNFYLLLDLYDPVDPTNDLVGNSDADPSVRELIQKQITEKTLQWNKEANKPKTGAAAKRNTELVAGALAALDTMDKRRQQHSDAKLRFEKAIRKRMAIFGVKGFFYESEVAKLADVTGYSEQRVRAFLAQSIEIREEKFEDKQLKKPEMAKALGETTELLKVYGYDTLYHLLGYPEGAKRSIVPTADLLAKAEDAARKISSKATEENAARKKMLNRAREVFASDSKRKEYDDYLSWQGMNEVLEELKMSASVTKEISGKQAAAAIERLIAAGSASGILLAEDDAIAYIRTMCRKGSIAWVEPEAEQRPDLMLCHYCTQVLPAGTQACKACGGLQFDLCPKCQTSNSVDNSFCASCSYDFSGRDSAERTLTQARELLAGLRLTDAAQLIDLAERQWATHPDIPKLRQRVSEAEDTHASKLKALATAVKDRRLVEANQLYTELKKLFPAYADPTLEQTITDGIAKSKSLASQATAGAVQNEELSFDAYYECKDAPEVVALFAAMAPPAPQNVMATPDSVAGRNEVTWDSPTSGRREFVVRRKLGNPPSSAADGELVGTVSDNRISDGNNVAGLAYYYSVVTRLGPTESPLRVSQAPALNLANPEHVSLRADAGSIRGTWKVAPNAVSVRASRREGNAPDVYEDGIPVGNITTHQMLDTNLVNDHQYGYLIQAGYQVDGATVYSPGVKSTATPSVPPAPVEWLMATLGEDSTFELEWDVPEKGEVRFFVSSTASAPTLGEAIESQSLQRDWLEVPVTARGPGKGLLKISGTDTHTVLATTEDGTQMIAGATALISSRTSPTIDRVQAAAGDVHLIFDWPADVERVLVAWKDGGYPSGPNDRSANRKVFTRGEYETLRAIRLRAPSPDGLHFVLFAEIGEGDSSSYLAPSYKAVGAARKGKITYSIGTKKRFGRLRGAVLELKTTSATPPLVLRGQVNASPVFPTQGMGLLDIPELAEAGSHRFELPAGLLKSGMYCKLFLVDQADYEYFDVDLSAGGRQKIG